MSAAARPGVVLVTGGAGYVGSHACKALRSQGRVPVAFDSVARGHASAVRWGPLERGDVRDAAALDEVFRAYAPEAVLHFAGLIEAGESVVEPERYYDVNVGGSLALLAAMRRHGCARLVFSSSCAVYGVAQQVPLAEDAPKAPISPYGRSKWMVEQVLADHAAAYGLRAVALRYFNAAGADPEGELGEAHAPETHLVPRVLQAAAEGSPVSVLGDDYPTVDGTCVRDYVHVSDLAEAHALALRYLEGGGATVALNVGTGRGASVREVIACAERVTGRAVRAVVAPRRPGDAPVLVASAARARQVLGWAPRWPELEAQVAHAWRWMQGAQARGAPR